MADGTDETANVKGVHKVPQKVPNEDRQRVQPFKKIMNISIVIPVYNAERYIKRCIEALLSQSYPEEDYEVIMVDNCSTDASAAIIKRFPAICLLSEKKQGAYAARNKGISASRGHIVAFTDPDCIAYTDWLQNIATVMESSDIRIVTGRRIPYSSSAVLSMFTSYENAKDEYVFNGEAKDLYYGYTNNMAVRRGLFKELGSFVEQRRGSDTIFVRRVVEEYSTNSVRYSPAVRVRHMELDSPFSYYRKMFIYGCNRRMCRRISYTRSLNNRERRLVLKKTVERHRYGLAQSSILFFLLVVGLGFWNLGGLAGAWNLKRKGLPL